MKKRALEEKAMVLQEITGTYKHFGRLQCELQDVLTETDSGGWYELGVHCLVLKYMMEIQDRLKKMYKRFSPLEGIHIPPPPELQVEIPITEDTDDDDDDDGDDDDEEEDEEDDESMDTGDNIESPATIDVEVMMDGV